jgi:hypothetical protein
MKTLKIKELCKMIKTTPGQPFVLNPNWNYPDWADYNFLTDYATNMDDFDRYFVKEHGEKSVDLDADSDLEIINAWQEELSSIYYVYMNSWAHIYDTLNIAYNPVYNVEEHITTKYGEHETEREYGAHETETEYGAHETEREFGATNDTFGTHTDTSTSYSVSFDTATEKETGKVSDTIGSQTNTSLAHTDTETSKLHTDTTTSKLHTDTETSKLHTDTVDRTGNIGIKSATALAEEEVFFRERRVFFKNLFLTISREVGAYYDY